MDIENFFKSLNLKVEFTDEYFHENYTNLFDHFKYPYETNTDDVIEELKNSYEFEKHENMKPEVYEKIMKEDNNVEKIYKIIEPKYPCKRDKAVHVNDMFGTIYTGAKQTYININYLQEWVNKFHECQFENKIDKILCGFILHLLYVRIHPHFDGNGRMSRYLFLENKLCTINFCPLSKILKECLELPMKYMNDIYNFIDESIDVNTAKEEDYYKLKINNKILKKIYYIIYISVCYKYCIKYNDKIIDLFNDYNDFKYIFCLGKAQHEVGKSTAIRISDGHRTRNQKLANEINKLLNFDHHVQLIKEFGITSSYIS